MLALVLLAPIAWTLVNIQRAANVACSQPAGDSNRRLTWANWIWLVLGSLFWILELIGLFAPA